MFSSVSHPVTQQNIATQDLAIEVIQESLLRANELRQQWFKKYVQDRLTDVEECDPDISIHGLQE